MLHLLQCTCESSVTIATMSSYVTKENLKWRGNGGKREVQGRGGERERGRERERETDRQRERERGE